MTRHILVSCAAAVLLGGAGPLVAHHSFTAAYDNTKRVEVEGVVTEFVWRNPHSFVRMAVTPEEGVTEDLEPRVGVEQPVVGREISRDADDAPGRRPHHRGGPTGARSEGQTDTHLQHYAAGGRLAVGGRRPVGMAAPSGTHAQAQAQPSSKRDATRRMGRAAGARAAGVECRTWHGGGSGRRPRRGGPARHRPRASSPRRI